MTYEQFCKKFDGYIDIDGYLRDHENETRERYRQLINNQLFAGKMSPKWYQKYNEFTLQGEFDPEQTFFIFVDAYNHDPEKGLYSLSQLDGSIRKARKLKKQDLI